MKHFIFDIDGTLANAEHRMHFIQPPPGGKKSWGAFFANSKNDEPYQHVAILNNLISEDPEGFDIHLITARPENERERTVTWLEKHDIRYSALHMRPNGEHKADFEVKRDIYKQHFESFKQDIACVFEDRLAVAKMWRSEGIPVLLCGDEWMKE